MLSGCESEEQNINKRFFEDASTFSSEKIDGNTYDYCQFESVLSSYSSNFDMYNRFGYSLLESKKLDNFSLDLPLKTEKTSQYVLSTSMFSNLDIGKETYFASSSFASTFNDFLKNNNFENRVSNNLITLFTVYSKTDTYFIDTTGKVGILGKDGYLFTTNHLNLYDLYIEYLSKESYEIESSTKGYLGTLLQVADGDKITLSYQGRDIDCNNTRSLFKKDSSGNPILDGYRSYSLNTKRFNLDSMIRIGIATSSLETTYYLNDNGQIIVPIESINRIDAGFMYFLAFDGGYNYAISHTSLDVNLIKGLFN